VAVAGCSGGGTDITSSSTKPQSGGILTYGSVQQPSCLDPGFAPETATGMIERNIFDSLVSVRTKGGPVQPWLATSWKVSADSRSYTFQLRTGVTFHDGTSFNADAVKATLDHIVDPETKSLNAAGLLSAYKSATVLSATSVRIDLKRPDAAFLQSLSTTYLGIQSPKSLAGTPCTHPVGTGPFSFVSWTPNKELDLKRNPAYQWSPPGTAHTGPAYLDGIQFQFISDDAARYGALTSGQVNVIENVPAADVKALKATGTDQFFKTDSPGTPYQLLLNSTKGPFADEKVRLAFQRSLDIDGLVDSIYFGVYERAWSALTPATQGYDPSLENSWPQDVAKANSLLDEAGWTGRDAQGYRTKDGKRLTVYWRTGAQLDRDQRSTLAQGIQADAKKVGFDVQYVAEDTGTFGKNIFAANLDIWGGSEQRAEPGVLNSEFASGETLINGGENIYGLNNPTLDGWLSEAGATSDWSVRARDYANVQQYVVQHGLQVPILVPANLLGAGNNVQGVSFAPDSSLRFYDIWLG